MSPEENATGRKEKMSFKKAIASNFYSDFQ